MPTLNLSLQPAVLRWARERAEKIKTKPDQVIAWEKTDALRFRQAETLAKATHTPFGFLFLPEPPDEPLGIPDFRTDLSPKGTAGVVLANGSMSSTQSGSVTVSMRRDSKPRCRHVASHGP